MYHDLRNHENPGYGDTLPRYSENDPMRAHGTEFPDDQAHEREHLLSEEEGAFEGYTSQVKSSNGSNHLRALSEVELATSMKMGNDLEDNDDLPRGILRSSRSSIFRLITPMTGC